MGIGGYFPGGKKRPGREADRSPPTSAEVKKTWIYTLVNAQLVKCSGNFIFTLQAIYIASNTMILASDELYVP
jgi:hypothetical protein